MAATVTDKLKYQLLNTLYDEVEQATNRYYVAIGRSEAWDEEETVPTPNNSFREIRNFKLSAQSIKQVTDVSFVIPRYNWVNGTIYHSGGNFRGTINVCYVHHANRGKHPHIRFGVDRTNFLFPALTIMASLLFDHD